MPILVRCPAGHALKVPSALEGKKIRCPKCGQTVRVPQEASDADQPSAPSPAAASPAESNPTAATPKRSRWRMPEPGEEIPDEPEPTSSPQLENATGESPSSAQPPPRPPRPEQPAFEQPPSRPAPPRPSKPPVPPREETAATAKEKVAAPSVSPPPLPFSVQEKPKQTRRHAVRPSRRHLRIVGRLASLLAVVGLTSILPGIVAWFGRMRGTATLEPWIWPLVVLGLLQLAYALYLVQLPDWSSVRVAALVAVLCGTFYSIGLGLAMFSGQQGGLGAMLGLSNSQSGRAAALWCLMLLSLSVLLAYFCGRVSHRWHREEILAETKPHLLLPESDPPV